MIEESYVSFDTAKMLKEAGFDVPCRGIYRAYRIGTSVFHEYDRKSAKDDLCWNSTDGFQYEYLAPTQALAAKWLREAHHINVYACFDYEKFDERKWFFTREHTMVNDDSAVYCSITNYNSYEEALEAGLKHSLELVKK